MGLYCAEVKVPPFTCGKNNLVNLKLTHHDDCHMFTSSLSRLPGYTAPSTHNVRKTSKAFMSLTVHCIDSRSSLCNSPGEALPVDVKSATLRPPVLGDLGGDKQTNRHTHTHTHSIRVLIDGLAETRSRTCFG